MAEQSQPARRGPYAKTTPRKAEIVAAATATFAAHGYQSGSLRQIAKQLELSLGAVMHHFPTKVSLLAAVLEQEDASDPDVAKRSRADGFIPTILEMVARNKRRQELVRMFSIVSSEATNSDHEAHAWLVRRYTRVTAMYADLIDYDRELGRLADGRDSEVLAAVVIGGWEGIQVRWLADGSDPVEMMRVFLVDLLHPLSP
ncbi:TetR/AcrR family transcriptional regulator [Microbacterium sp. LWO13-1.2]|uniref:TetR/AcrR family transcriptional regulator n=1 Tax=Microbacterium sp. LWO13-1.2 TaxID=3135262 RepID=UPI0031388643